MKVSFLFISLCLQTFCHLAHCKHRPENGGNKTLTLGYSLPWSRGWNVGTMLAPAIVLGIREVHKRQLLLGYEIEWMKRDSYCEPRRGMTIVVDMWASVEHLDGIIGDGCSAVCQPQALLAAAWNIPVVAWWCSSPMLSDKSIYPTFTRVKGPWANLGPMYNAVANVFGWKRVAIIFNSADLWTLTAEAIRNGLEEGNKEVIMRLIDYTNRGETNDEKSMQDLRSTLIMLKSIAKVIILFCYSIEINNIMHVAVEEGMMNGEYTFIIQPVDVMPKGYCPYQAELGTFRCQGLIGFQATPPSGSEYDRFLEDVIREFQKPAFDDMPHLPASASIDKVSPNAGKSSYIKGMEHVPNMFMSFDNYLFLEVIYILI